MKSLSKFSILLILLCPTSIWAATTTNTTTTLVQGTPCPTPSTFANVILPPPPELVDKSYYPSDDFIGKSLVFETVTPNTEIPQASILSYCLDKCIEYQLSTAKSCLSVFVDQGKPFCQPPAPESCLEEPKDMPNWYCAGFNQSLSQEDYGARNAPGSFQFGVGVNRVCGGNYRAY